jgi:hypothetical protein
MDLGLVLIFGAAGLNPSRICLDGVYHLQLLDSKSVSIHELLFETLADKAEPFRTLPFKF